MAQDTREAIYQQRKGMPTIVVGIVVFLFLCFIGTFITIFMIKVENGIISAKGVHLNGIIGIIGGLAALVMAGALATKWRDNKLPSLGGVAIRTALWSLILGLACGTISCIGVGMSAAHNTESTTVTAGQTFETDDFTLNIKDVSTTSKLYPRDTSGSYSYLHADGTTLVVVKAKVKNKTKSSIDLNEDLVGRVLLTKKKADSSKPYKCKAFTRGETKFHNATLDAGDEKTIYFVAGYDSDKSFKDAAQFVLTSKLSGTETEYTADITL